MGVILKRMMLRVGDRIAEELDIDALVTGECVAQVSSQTVRNLAVIDSVTDRLVLRPLIASDKNDIIKIAAQIGTEEFAANMPEYCGVISVNPTTRAKRERVEAEERNFDMAIIDRAIANSTQTRIDKLADRRPPSNRCRSAQYSFSAQHHYRYSSSRRRGDDAPGVASACGENPLLRVA